MNSVRDPLTPWRTDAPLTDDELQFFPQLQQHQPGAVQGLALAQWADEVYLRYECADLNDGGAEHIAHGLADLGRAMLQTSQADGAVGGLSLALHLWLVGFPNEDGTAVVIAKISRSGSTTVVATVGPNV